MSGRTRRALDGKLTGHGWIPGQAAQPVLEYAQMEMEIVHFWSKSSPRVPCPTRLWAHASGGAIARNGNRHEEGVEGVVRLGRERERERERSHQFPTLSLLRVLHQKKGLTHPCNTRASLLRDIRPDSELATVGAAEDENGTIGAEDTSVEGATVNLLHAAAAQSGAWDLTQTISRLEVTISQTKLAVVIETT